MSRPTTAATCGQQTHVLVAGQAQSVPCSRAEAHKGPHQGRIQWSPRGTPALTPRR
jgi:hypothetical protein